MTAATKIKTGTRIQVDGLDSNMTETWEPAKIARKTKQMGTLPDGYFPVRFADGARLLVHASRFRVIDNRA